jgi:hypothetical protein
MWDFSRLRWLGNLDSNQDKQSQSLLYYVDSTKKKEVMLCLCRASQTAENPFVMISGFLAPKSALCLGKLS